MFDIKEPKTSTNTVFLSEVLQGLSQQPKRLSSKYFYDQKGDELFQKIMAMDEYYLTRAEYEIFESHKQTMLDLFSSGDLPFNLIEFGAGDGYKTKVLLNYFTDSKTDFAYLPIDISQNALDGLKSSLNEEIPDLDLKTLQGDYFEVLDQLSHSKERKNIVLFLGSNIGNFSDQEAKNFLSKIRKGLNKGDELLLGVDLKKDPNKILRAYNDERGITSAFNLNLLERINRELEGNFEMRQFRHHASYDPVTGVCSSALISLEDQEVQIGTESFSFKKWEPIHTEISKKYSRSEINELADFCGFAVIKDLSDSEGYFVDSIWRAV